MKCIESYLQKLWSKDVCRIGTSEYTVCSKFGYVSIYNIFAFGFDISCYSQWIFLKIGYASIGIVAP